MTALPPSRPLRVPLGPGLPELELLRPVDQEALLQEALAHGTEALPDGGTPYYAELWPAAVPLARWLLERARGGTDPTVPRPGDRVLELGCGLGVVGLALAKLGARAAITDGSEPAVALVRAVLERNGPYAHEPAVAVLDWRSPEAVRDALGGRFPFVVGADVLYSPEAFPWLARAAAETLAPAGTLFLAEPQRPVARSARGHLEAVGLVLAGTQEATNGVVVQTWRAR